MLNRRPSELRLCLAACVAVSCSRAQPASEVLALMDRFAHDFAGAKATLRTIDHTVGLPEDEVANGAFLVKRSGGRSQFLIAFAEPNARTVRVGEQLAEVYLPKIDEIDEYNIRNYKDIVQKLFLLGFGMPGKELAANYDVRNVKHEMLGSQSATYLELIPKSPDVRGKLKSVELWISNANQCPLRQVFHMPDGGFRTAEFSAVQLNPKFAGDAFDLPKGAKRVRVN